MTAFDTVIENGDYRRFHSSMLDFHMNSPFVTDLEASRRFLVRVLSRAILDVCMYGDDDERHTSAREWLLGDIKAVVSFTEIAELVGLDFLEGQIFSLAEQEGVHRDKVRDMKRLLYNYDGSSNQPS